MPTVNKVKIGPAILSGKILHHQRWRANLWFHSIQKLRVILRYSKSFKRMSSNRNTSISHIRIFLHKSCVWAKLHSSKGRLLKLSQSSVRHCSRLRRPDDCEYGFLLFWPQILNTLLTFLTPKRSIFKGGDLLVSVKLWRTLKVARFLRLTPLVRLGKGTRIKLPFRIIH